MIYFIDDNGNELDYDGKDFAITRQAFSFYNFKFKGDSSVNIKFPNTTKNKSIFSNYGAQQVAPLSLITVNVFKNGNKTDRGQLVILEIDNEIECFFITGNSSWFKLWSFNCNEIVTTKYDVGFGWSNAMYSIEETWGNTDGIIFPVIDWAFGGQQGSEEHFGILNCYVGDGSSFITDPDYKYVHMMMPCLYVHTLLKLLSNHARTTITGTLFEDKFFKSVIITPKGPENFSYSYGESFGTPRIVKPEHIAPKIKATEFLKWVAASFGCIVTFDNESNSISVDLITRKKKEDAKDWSKYYISHKIEQSKFYDKNLIEYGLNSQADVAEYDAVNTTPFGGLLVDSDKNDNSEQTVYTAPFLTSFDTVGNNTLGFATPNVDFYRFTDGEGYAMTSVTFTAGGAVQFNGSGFPWVNSGNEFIVRIECDNNIYSGYWICTSGTTTSLNPKFGVTFRGNSTGTIYVQSVSYNNSGHRVLSCLTNVSPSTFCKYPTIYFPPVLGVSARTSVAYAYFHKALTPYSLLNQYDQGLSYGEVEGRKDNTLGETYLRPFTNILKNPPVRATMLLPEIEVSGYNDEYVYINADDLNGYFLVEKIENFKQSDIPVDVYLVKD